MDGNRTHPGRLSSAPQTVLKTAGLASTTVHQRPPEFDRWFAHSMVARPRPRLSVKVSSPGESHPRALSEPGVSLATYPAPTTHTGWFDPGRPMSEEVRLPPCCGGQEPPCA